MNRYGAGDDNIVVDEYLCGGIKQGNLDIILDLIDEYVEVKEAVNEN